MMREHILKLHFVNETDDGRLDYWSPPATGVEETDIQLGRSYAARLLHLYREFDCQHLAAFILERWVETAPRCRGFVRNGFAIEGCLAMRAAPEDATAAMRTARIATRGNTLKSLPFVVHKGGKADAWAVESSGDWSQDNAAGRHYGALTVLFVRESGSDEIVSMILESMASDPERFERTRGIWTGWITEIAEVQTASCPEATIYQQSAMPHHKAGLAA
jgi:hypothetical protein